MHFGLHRGAADLLRVLEAFGHGLRDASQHRKIAILHLGDDSAVSDPDIVTVTIDFELAFRLNGIHFR